MNGNRDIHDQVREVLGGDEKVSEDVFVDEESARFKIKAKFVEWMSCDYAVFPARGTFRAITDYLCLNICDLFEQYGQEEVQAAIDELEIEFKEQGWELPDYNCVKENLFHFMYIQKRASL